MVSLVNSLTNATRIGWHLWEIDLRFAPGLPPGWLTKGCSGVQCEHHSVSAPGALPGRCPASTYTGRARKFTTAAALSLFAVSARIYEQGSTISETDSNRGRSVGALEKQQMDRVRSLLTRSTAI